MRLLKFTADAREDLAKLDKSTARQIYKKLVKNSEVSKTSEFCIAICVSNSPEPMV